VDPNFVLSLLFVEKWKASLYNERAAGGAGDAYHEHIARPQQPGPADIVSVSCISQILDVLRSSQSITGMIVLLLLFFPSETIPMSRSMWRTEIILLVCGNEIFFKT
jgi:hypothetical protein